MKPEYGFFGFVKLVKPVDLKVGDVVEFAYKGWWGIFGLKYCHRIVAINGDTYSIKGDNAKNIDLIPKSWIIFKVVKYWSVF